MRPFALLQLLALVASAAAATTARAATDADSLAREAARVEARRVVERREAATRRTWLRGATESLDEVVGRSGGAPVEQSYIIVNLRERMLWYVVNGEIRFTAQVAVGMGTPDDSTAPARGFATPRGRMVVTRRDSMPLWVPPDWHFREQARKTGRGLRALVRGDSIVAADGSVYRVAGAQVVRRDAAGAEAPVAVPAGKELVVDGRIVVPPLGTTMRQYPKVLGARRLYLQDAYGLHGTTDPTSIGKKATHGCVRLTNDAITALYEMVPVGTPVYLR